MGARNNLMINFDGQTLFRVVDNNSFTVPTTVVASSPTNAQSGISPGTLFDTRRDVAGGMIYGVWTDQAGNNGYDFQYPLRGGDIVAVSNVAANTCNVTVNGKVVYVITDTAITVAGVLGFYG